MSIEINTDTMPVRNMEKRNTALCEMSGALALLIILHYEYTFEKEGFSRPSPYGRDKSAPTEGWCLIRGDFHGWEGRINLRAIAIAAGR